MFLFNGLVVVAVELVPLEEMALQMILVMVVVELLILLQEQA